jgi:hypothetical protein
MKFVLAVDLEKLTGDPVYELGRILRYWAGNLKYYELVAGDRQEIYDSTYQAVGEWRID